MQAKAESHFHCLMEDNKLLTGLSLATDEMLDFDSRRGRSRALSAMPLDSFVQMTTTCFFIETPQIDLFFWCAASNSDTIISTLDKKQSETCRGRKCVISWSPL
jgi:hypothetical protein